MVTVLRRSGVFCCLMLFLQQSTLLSQQGIQFSNEINGQLNDIQQRLQVLENTSLSNDNRGSLGVGRGGWVSSFDFLAWTVRDNGFEYGVTDIGGVQDRGAVGTVLSLGSRYENGFRMSLGRE